MQVDRRAVGDATSATASQTSTSTHLFDMDVMNSLPRSHPATCPAARLSSSINGALVLVGGDNGLQDYHKPRCQPCGRTMRMALAARDGEDCMVDDSAASAENPRPSPPEMAVADRSGEELVAHPHPLDIALVALAVPYMLPTLLTAFPDLHSQWPHASRAALLPSTSALPQRKRPMT